MERCEPCLDPMAPNRLLPIASCTTTLLEVGCIGAMCGTVTAPFLRSMPYANVDVAAYLVYYMYLGMQE
jgi:hypothetical protein